MFFKLMAGVILLAVLIQIGVAGIAWKFIVFLVTLALFCVFLLGCALLYRVTRRGTNGLRDLFVAIFGDTVEIDEEDEPAATVQTPQAETEFIEPDEDLDDGAVFI